MSAKATRPKTAWPPAESQMPLCDQGQPPRRKGVHAAAKMGECAELRSLGRLNPQPRNRIDHKRVSSSPRQHLRPKLHPGSLHGGPHANKWNTVGLLPSVHAHSAMRARRFTHTTGMGASAGLA
eukprot:2578028-Alexandrium_andersonii.AAC.1